MFLSLEMNLVFAHVTVLTDAVKNHTNMNQQGNEWWTNDWLLNSVDLEEDYECETLSKQKYEKQKKPPKQIKMWKQRPDASSPQRNVLSALTPACLQLTGENFTDLWHPQIFHIHRGSLRKNKHTHTHFMWTHTHTEEVQEQSVWVSGWCNAAIQRRSEEKLKSLFYRATLWLKGDLVPVPLKCVRRH